MTTDVTLPWFGGSNQYDIIFEFIICKYLQIYHKFNQHIELQYHSIEKFIMYPKMVLQYYYLQYIAEP